MKIKFQIFIVIFLMISKTSVGQKRWTLDDCIEYAVSHNLNIQKSNYNQDSKKETYKQSYRNLLPSINGSSDYNIRYGRSVDPNDNSISDTKFFINNYSLEASVDLFQGFQKINTIKASKFLFEAVEKETLHEKYLLALRVMEAFYNVHFFKGALKIAEEQEKVSQVNLKLVKRKIELGIEAGGSLYEAESILLTEQLNVTKIYNQLVNAKLLLIQEMNLENTTEISLVEGIDEKEILTSNVDKQVDSIYKGAESFLPKIKAEEFKLKAAKKQLSVERGKLYPSLSLFGRYGTGYVETIKDNSGQTVSFGKQFKDNSFQVVGVSLKIPISLGWSLRSKVKQQKIAYLNAEKDLQIQKQIVYKTIQDLVQKNNAFRTEYNQTLKNVEVQKVAFNVAQKRFEKGLISAIELYTAKNLYANAQSESLQAGLKVKVNESTLDFYQGLPVFNIKK